MKTYLIVVELTEVLKGYLVMNVDKDGNANILVARRKENASVFSGQQVEEIIGEIKSREPGLNIYQEEFKEVFLQ